MIGPRSASHHRRVKRVSPAQASGSLRRASLTRGSVLRRDSEIDCTAGLQSESSRVLIAQQYCLEAREEGNEERTDRSDEALMGELPSK
jgi:hypothetical protein